MSKSMNIFKEKGMFLLLIVISVVFVLAGCNSSGGTNDGDGKAKENGTEWDFHLHIGLDEGTGVFMSGFADAVTEKTDGELTIIARPPGELPYSSTEAIGITSDRSVEMADAPIGYVAGDLDVSVVPTFPFIASQSMDLFKEAMDVVMPLANDELAQFGIESLFFLQDPPQTLWGVGEPITNLDQLKGLKIRTFAPEQQDLLKELGATPVSLGFDEIPEAIERGVIDGVITGSLAFNDAKWDEIFDWGYNIPILGSGSFMVVNSDALNELSDEVRELVLEEAAIWEGKSNEKAIQAANETMDEIAGKGVEINDVTPEDFEKAREITRPLWDKWAKTDEAKEALKTVLEITD